MRRTASAALLARAAPRLTGAALGASHTTAAQFSDADEPPPSNDESSLRELIERAEHREKRLFGLKQSGARRGTGAFVHQLLRPSPLLQPPAPKPPPSRIATDFDIDYKLGAGAFGVVAAATSRVDGRQYAIKATRAAGQADACSEARALAAIPAHRNLVRYHSSWMEDGPPAAGSPLSLRDLVAGSSLGSSLDYTDEANVGEEERSGRTGSERGGGLPARRPQSAPDSTLYLQMELCPLPTLKDILTAESGTLAGLTGVGVAPEAVRWQWIAGVANGLGAMHAAGFAHNDVKPANVLCSPRGDAKLIDLGLASAIAPPSPSPRTARGGGGTRASCAPATAPDLGRAPSPHSDASDERSAATEKKVGIGGSGGIGERKPGGVAGTEMYLAPERCAGAPPSSASDVFSLGVCVAEVHGRFATAMERALVLSSLKSSECGHATLSAPPSPTLRAQREPSAAVSAAAAPPVAPRERRAAELARGMLQAEPTARPSTREVGRRAESWGALAAQGARAPGGGVGSLEA